MRTRHGFLVLALMATGLGSVCAAEVALEFWVAVREDQGRIRLAGSTAEADEERMRGILQWVKRQKGEDPASYESMRCWVAYQKLREQAVRMRMVEAASPGDQRRLPVVMFPADDPALGLTGLQNVGVYIDSYELKGQRLRVLHFGEKGTAPQPGGDARTPEWAETMLVHESAHVGERNPCTHMNYGADDSHWSDEIITYASAFTEGWAHSWSGRWTQPLAGEVYLNIEEVGNRRGGDGYHSLEARELTLWDFAANEAFCARVLARLNESLGKDVVLAAFGAIQPVACKTLGDFLAALVGQNPRSQEAVKAILRRESLARFADADLARLLAAGYPAGQDRHSFPRRFDPAARAAGGMLGQ